MKYTYYTTGTCSKAIFFELDGNVVSNISYMGGCNGNTKAVAALCDGLTVEEIEDRIGGITCGYRPTSCGDQLAVAVRQALDGELKPDESDA